MYPNDEITGLDVLGSTVLGDFDLASILKTAGAGAGELAANLVHYKKTLPSVLAADKAATEAIAQALYSADIATNTPPGPAQSAAIGKAQADDSFAKQATFAQDTIAQTLPADLAQKRFDAARAALLDATKKSADAAGASAKDPTNPAKKVAADRAKFYVKAAAATAIKVANAQITASTGSPATDAEQQRIMDELRRAAGEEESFFTRPIVGGIPGWGLLAGIAAAIGGVFLWKRYRS